MFRQSHDETLVVRQFQGHESISDSVDARGQPVFGYRYQMDLASRNSRLAAKDIVDNTDQLGPTEIIQTLTAQGNIDDVLTGVGALTEFREYLQGLHLVELDSLSPKAQEALSQFGAYMSGLAIGELRGLLESAGELQSRADELLWQARPGILALLIGQKKNANVQLKVGSAEGIPAMHSVIDEMAQYRLRAEALKTSYNGVYKLPGLSKDQADALRADYARQINEVAEACEEKLQKLGAMNEPIALPNQPHPPSHITIDAGEAQEQLEAMVERQRKLLRNDVVLGTPESTLKKPIGNGAVISGSLSLIMLVASYYNWLNTRNEMEKRSQLTLPQAGEYVAALFGFISAGLSVGVDIVRTGVILDLINQGSTKALQNVAGGVVAVGNGVIAPVNLIATIWDSSKQMGRIYHDWKQRDLTALSGSMLALAGDGIQAWKSWQLTYIGARVISDAIAEKITFRMAGQITMRFAVEFNPYMLLATALIVAGELAHNYLQSTPLLHWVSRGEWGKQGWWPGYEYQGWDYATQLRHWQEVIQAPQLLLETDSVTEEQWVAHGNNCYPRQVEMQQLRRFRLMIPMAAPSQVRIAGMMTVAGQDQPVDITTSNLLKYHQLTFDGLNTVYEFSLPLSRKKYRPLRYLDLLVEITNPQGDILFAEHNGARFSLNLLHPEHSSKPLNGDNHRYTLDVLEDGDTQVVDEDTLKGALKKLTLSQKGNL